MDWLSKTKRKGMYHLQILTTYKNKAYQKFKAP